MSDDATREFRLDDPEADALMVSTPETWLYLPKLFYYPLRGFALPVVVTLGLGLWLAGYAGPFGMPLSGVMLGFLGYYSMNVVQRTALGHAIPPPLGSEALFQGERLRLLALIAYIGGSAACGILASRAGHPGYAALIGLTAVYFLPAFLANLVLQQTLGGAVNPINLLEFVFHTGAPYLVACLALAGVGYLVVLLSGHVGEAVLLIVLVYGLVFVCHMVGYVAYHRHEQLGIAVHVARPTAESRALEEQQERLAFVLKQVDKQLQAHDAAAARDLLLAESSAELINPRSFHEELFEALRQRHQDALSLVQAERLMNLLVKTKRFPRALDIWEQCLDFAKDFVPAPAGMVGLLAEQALKEKRLPLFARIDAAVQARRPAGEEAVCLRFLKAQGLVDQRQDATALALLTPLLASDTHPWAPRIQALHRALQGMRQKA
jgi:tetratricopeptide (TPR) repeat protein